MAGIERIVDLHVPLVREGRYMRYKTELLIHTLEEQGYSTSSEDHNLYHGLNNAWTMGRILASNAIMGPELVREYDSRVAEGDEYVFPEERHFILTNPPDDGEYVGLANLEYASRVATSGLPLNEAFNSGEPIILCFKPRVFYPIVSVTYIKLDDPIDGLGAVIAPSHMKDQIESDMAVRGNLADIARIYVDFEPAPAMPDRMHLGEQLMQAARRVLKLR